MWISIKKETGIGLIKTADGLNCILCLSGNDRRKKNQVLRLLNAYEVTDQPDTIDITNKRPRKTCIGTLKFADVNHLALVMGQLIQRYFPLSVVKMRIGGKLVES